jgi:hypothetical protein
MRTLIGIAASFLQPQLHMQAAQQQDLDSSLLLGCLGLRGLQIPSLAAVGDSSYMVQRRSSNFAGEV